MLVSNVLKGVIASIVIIDLIFKGIWNDSETYHRFYLIRRNSNLIVSDLVDSIKVYFDEADEDRIRIVTEARRVINGKPEAF